MGWSSNLLPFERVLEIIEVTERNDLFVLHSANDNARSNTDLICKPDDVATRSQ